MRTLLIFALMVAPAFGQVFKLDAGSSTMYNATGASVTMFLPGSETHIGAGVENGHLVAGATEIFDWKNFDVTAGDKSIMLTVDAAGIGIASRGLFVERKTKTVTLAVFTAACGQLFSAPYFSGTVAKDFCTGYTLRKTAGRFEFESVAAYEQRKVTALESAAYNWKGLRVAGSGGLLERAPLFNGSASYHTDTFGVGASRVLNVWQGKESTVNAVSGSVRFSVFGVGASAYHSIFENTATDGQSIQGTADVRATRLLLSYFSSKYARITMYGLNQHIGQRWNATAYATTNHGNTSLNFGGSYAGNRFTASASWSQEYYPFVVGRSPWSKTLSAQLTVNIHDTSVTGSVVTLPTGPRWSVFGSQYAYGKADLSPSNHVPAPNIGKLVVSVAVVDADGKPVEFAVVYLGRSVCLTDSAGQCEVRFKKANSLSVRVAVDEFAAGSWVVVDAPATVTPPASIVVKVCRK